MIKKIKKLLSSNISTKQTIAKNIFWLFTAEGVSKLLMFFLAILIARYLGAAGYGIFSFAFAFVVLFAVVADFGLSTLMIREVARNKKLARKYIGNIAVMKLILGIITFALIVLIVQFLGKTLEVKTLVYLAGIFIIVNSFTGFFQSIFNAFEKMQYSALSRIIYSISLFIIAFFVMWQKFGIKLLVQSYIVAALISFFVTLILVRKKFTEFWSEIDFGFWKNLLKEAWPFALGGVFVSIYFWIDTVMLSIMTVDQVVGWYNVAYKLVFALAIFPAFFMISVYPKMSRAFISSKEDFIRGYKQSLKYIFLMAIFLFPLLFIFSKQIILFLYSTEYIQSVIAFKVLLWAEFFAFFSHAFMFVLNAMNKQILYTRVVGISLIVNIVLNLLLIPKYSYIGASIATVATEFLAFSLLFLYTKQNITKFKEEKL